MTYYKIEGEKKIYIYEHIKDHPYFQKLEFWEKYLHSDSVSVNRKRLLGIEMDKQFLPIDKDYSSRAMNDLNRIKVLNDSSYADINAKAAFRLACYYVMENKLIRRDLKEGKEYLLTAREWAIIAENDSLLKIIEAGLATF